MVEQADVQKCRAEAELFVDEASNEVDRFLRIVSQFGFSKTCQVVKGQALRFLEKNPEASACRVIHRTGRQHDAGMITTDGSSFFLTTDVVSEWDPSCMIIGGLSENLHGFLYAIQDLVALKRDVNLFTQLKSTPG